MDDQHLAWEVWVMFFKVIGGDLFNYNGKCFGTVSEQEKGQTNVSWNWSDTL